MLRGEANGNTSPLIRWGLVLGALCASVTISQAACDSRGRRSQNSNVPTKITFVNQSGAYRNFDWMDFQGQSKSYGGINSGESKSIDTFVTHPWVVTDGPGNCIQIVMPRAGGSVVRLAPARGSGRGE